MAAGTTKSSSITNYDAEPRVLTQSAFQHAALRTIVETKELASTELDDVGDIIRMVRVPATAVIQAIYILNDDLDAHATPTAAFDLGLYTKNGGAVKDADAYGSALTALQAANTTVMTNFAFESAVKNIADIKERVFQDAGDSDASEGQYDIAMTVTTAAATFAAGTVTFIVVYSDDQ